MINNMEFSLDQETRATHDAIRHASLGGNYLFIKDILDWCPGPGLNRHGRNGRRILSPLRLPIPPPGQG